LEFVGIVEIVGIVGICWTEVVRAEVVGIFYKIKKSAVKRRYLTSSAYTSWISVRSSKWSCRVQGAVILNRRYTLTLEDYGTLEIPI
jgi:hypothetical protein